MGQLNLHQFDELSLDVSSLIVTISAFVKKIIIYKICETNGGQIKE